MKRTWIVIMLLGLLLAGCAGNNDSDKDNTALAEPTSLGLYQHESLIQLKTNAAVRRYDLPGESYSWISAIGDKLLLASCEEGTTQLTILSGAEAIPSATVELTVDLSTENAVWQSTYSGFAYFDPQDRKVVFLDPQLQILDEITMPDNMEGEPVISADGGEIFYCTADEIRVLETEHKISRLLKFHNCIKQQLIGSYFDGDIIACYIEDLDNRVSTQYLSAENGQTLASDSNILSLYTYENTYLVLRQDGVRRQNIVGNREEAPKDLQVQSEVAAALELGGVVGYETGDSGITFSMYMLDSGMKTCQVTVSGIGLPRQILADRWSGCIWMLTTDAETGANILLRWDCKSSPVDDGSNYITTLYTVDAPDTAGLAECQSRVDALNKKYGVTIRIWEKAVASANGYLLQKEHLVPVIHRTLDVIEGILDQFPGKFLDESVKRTIRICIVRSVESQVKSAYYWYQNDPFIVLSAESDIAAELLQGIGYVLDEHVRSNSYKFDDWNALNPEGFVYADTTTYSESYLKGDAMAFFSEDAMASETEDRMWIFRQAMLPDNADAFENDTMQAKLRLMCQAIREAWRLQWKSDTYHWEQYLDESLAY